MTLNLVCPKCGFAFGVCYSREDLSYEELKELMICPCGTMMIKTGHLFGNVIKADEDGE